ncbi:MAG: hypothetical protein RR011_06490, partial [Oscillospiraceae bacterium]
VPPAAAAATAAVGVTAVSAVDIETAAAGNDERGVAGQIDTGSACILGIAVSAAHRQGDPLGNVNHGGVAATHVQGAVVV